MELRRARKQLAQVNKIVFSRQPRPTGTKQKYLEHMPQFPVLPGLNHLPWTAAPDVNVDRLVGSAYRKGIAKGVYDERQRAMAFLPRTTIREPGSRQSTTYADVPGPFQEYFDIPRGVTEEQLIDGDTGHVWSSYRVAPTQARHDAFQTPVTPLSPGREEFSTPAASLPRDSPTVSPHTPMRPQRSTAGVPPLRYSPSAYQ